MSPDRIAAADQKIDQAADKIQQTANRYAGDSGLKGKLAPVLAEDAEFLRKLKPSLVAARARGEAPTDQLPGSAVVAPSSPQLGKRPNATGTDAGPSPFAVVGMALTLGVFLAKLVDWRSHAHPR